MQQLSAENATIAEGPVHSTSKIDLWHQRLAHVNLRQLCQQIESSDGVNIQSQGKLNFCEVCVQGKCHQKPHYPLKAIKSKEKLQLVHTDVCGPMQTQSFGESDISSHLLMTTHDIVEHTFKRVSQREVQRVQNFCGDRVWYQD